MPPFNRRAALFLMPYPIALQYLALQRSILRFAILAFALFPILSGCQSFQNRMSQRCARCGALCAQAREAREQGNSERANEFINAALQQKPADFETRRQLAETMWVTGRKAEAVQEFSALCAEQPPDAKLGARLAVMQWEVEQRSAAARTANLVLQIDPNSQDALLIKARSEVFAGKLDDALNTYMRLTQIAPDELTAMIELGDLQLRRNQPDRARPLFRAVLEHPRTTPAQRAQAQWLLGVAYANSQRWTTALPLLENSISHRNASANDWCLVASARHHNGDRKLARRDLQRAFLCDPECAAALKLQKELDLSDDLQFDKHPITQASHEETL